MNLSALWAKSFTATDIFTAEQISFPEQNEKIYIISFFSEKTSTAVFEWLSILPLKRLNPEKIEFINIVFPGGLFFMIPPKKALATLRQQISDEIEKNLANCHIEQQRFFQSLRIRWIADFQRKIFRSWGLDSQESWFFFFSPTQEPVLYKGFSRLQSLDLLIRLELKNNK